MVYQYAWSGFKYDVPAQVVGEVCEKIEATQGSLTRENFLQSASDESSPCHKLFNWNDTDAAHKWRLHQAGNILSALKVEVVEQKKEPVTVRAFVNTNPIDTGGTYMHVVQALKGSETRNNVLIRAVRELEIFREKYSALEELKKVFEAIAEVEATMH